MVLTSVPIGIYCLYILIGGLLRVLAHNIACLSHSIHELGIVAVLDAALCKRALSCPENTVEL
jgi:hypothetical protein